MTDMHFANFIGGIQKGEKLNAPIEVGNVAVTMLQLSNVAWKLNRGLTLDPATGKVLNDAEADEVTGIASTRRAGLQRSNSLLRNLPTAALSLQAAVLLW